MLKRFKKRIFHPITMLDESKYVVFFNNGTCFFIICFGFNIYKLENWRYIIEAKCHNDVYLHKKQ